MAFKNSQAKETLGEFLEGASKRDGMLPGINEADEFRICVGLIGITVAGAVVVEAANGIF